MRRRLLATAAAVTVFAFTGWVTVAPDALIRYPDDLDQTLSYRGVVSTPTTPGHALDVHRNLTVTRHIWVAASTANTASIREVITTKIDGESRRQTNGYVIDRRTMKIRNEAEGNFAFTEDNRVRRPGSYGPTLAMDLDTSGKYQLWSDDTGSSFPMIGADKLSEAHGLTLATLTTNVGPRPVTAEYRDFLDLPRTTTLQDLATIAGVDLDGVLATLATAVSPVVLAEVTEATTMALPLDYFLESNGEIRVEPRTGGIVDVASVVNRLMVRPDLDAVPLRTILGAYLLDPVVRTVLAEVDELAERPAIPAMIMRYAQTPASVRAAAAEATRLRHEARRVTHDIPLGIGALAILFAVGALLPPRQKAERLRFPRHHRPVAGKIA